LNTVKRALLLSVLLLISFPAISHAQPSEFHMSLAPSKMELTLSPGATTDYQMHLENFSDQSQNLKISFMDYYFTEKNTVVFAKAGHFSYSCATWLSTDSHLLHVPGRGNADKSRVEKNFTVKVPQNAEPGGHYAVILFTQPAVKKKGVPVKISGQIGALVMITVPGEIVRSGEIKSVSISSAWLWPTRRSFLVPFSPTRYKVVFQNTGNVHITVRGKLTYEPTFGWGASTINLPEMTVLPGTTRDFEGKIPNPPLFGSYKVQVVMQYGPNLFVFDTTKTKSSKFDSYPVLTLVLLLLVLPAVIILFVRRRRKRRRGKEELGEERPGKKKRGKEKPGKEVPKEKEKEEKEKKEEEVAEEEAAEVEERSWESFGALWRDEEGEEPEEEPDDNGTDK
jgi:hypothetical protein